MVDEYLCPVLCPDLFLFVQIPLWSMNTGRKKRTNPLRWQVQIPLWSMNTLGSSSSKDRTSCSDSSMVDEYARARKRRDWGFSMVDEYPRTEYRKPGKRRVQIPLWSMNTQAGSVFAQSFQRSDSSMVDEYRTRPLSGELGAMSSDSSMVDEYYPCRLPPWSIGLVQIPLWSMNTLV